MALPLGDIADVQIIVNAAGAALSAFNVGLIIGPSEVIPLDTQCKEYASLDEMVEDGFTTNSVEYLAASKYFAQRRRPRRVVIGRAETGQTPLEAVQACRSKNSTWYGAYVPIATEADHLEIAEYFQTLNEPASMYFVESNDADLLTGEDGTLFKDLDEANYSKTHGVYSTTTHAAAAVMGWAMGNTNDFSNSAYTLKFKRFEGFPAENLTSAQLTELKAVNANTMCKRANRDELTGYEEGRNFGGRFFDSVIYADKLASDAKISVANELYSSLKVPQTEDGMGQLRAVVAAAGDKMRRVGYLAPGRWNGDDILNIRTGDFLADGYTVLSDPIITQEQEDREARKAPMIYLLAKEAGAFHSLVIGIIVNQ